jgi:hypothetical protein
LNPYYAVFRTNRNFRLLFIGQAISQLGDWFNSVAVLALLLELTGSATAVAMFLSAAPNLAVAALCVLVAHLGGSILWVFSTVLLQMEVPDRFRGRVFSVELALMTITLSISSY